MAHQSVLELGVAQHALVGRHLVEESAHAPGVAPGHGDERLEHDLERVGCVRGAARRRRSGGGVDSVGGGGADSRVRHVLGSCGAKWRPSTSFFIISGLDQILYWVSCISATDPAQHQQRSAF